MTKWSPQQEKALSDTARWLKDPGDQQLFRLFGYAGTGKTTLAKHLAQGIDGEVLFSAFTGKAASVLKANGAPNARTLHSLIYIPKERSKERLIELKEELEEVEQMVVQARYEDGAAHDDSWTPPHQLQKRVTQLKIDIKQEEANARRPNFALNLESPLREASLLVVDECSMVDEQMALDILSFKKPVLVLGDPAQLPPVGGAGYFTEAKPNIMLTEIHRQSKDNPIIALATRVRNGEQLQLGAYGESSVITRATPELALAADQVLVGKNSTRLSTNVRMRALKGYTQTWPQAGEKVVCLRNDANFNLLNGTLHVVAEDSEEHGGYINLRIRPEGEPDATPTLVSAHPEHFTGNGDDIGHWTRRDAQEFTFGYALTVHKSQGSQWGNVMVIDQSGVFRDRDTSRRWLYTAITRAQNVVTIVGG